VKFLLVVLGSSEKDEHRISNIDAIQAVKNAERQGTASLHSFLATGGITAVAQAVVVVVSHLSKKRNKH
jgi:hypothetical protein